MKPSPAAFDKLLARAEESAASFDAEALTTAMGALTAYMDEINANADLDRATLEHMRSRLIRYQRLCLFLQNTLHKALVGALSMGEPACYVCERGPHPHAAPSGAKQSHLAPLIRRYC